MRTCTCYSSHVLRPSHCPTHRNEQRRPHADMHIYNYDYTRTPFAWVQHRHADIIYTSRGIYCCFVFDESKEVAKFQDIKTKAPSKRLSIMSSPPYRLNHKSELRYRHGDVANLQIICDNSRAIHGNLCFKDKGTTN